jgi:hypothetical protein
VDVPVSQGFTLEAVDLTNEAAGLHRIQRIDISDAAET